MTVAIDAHIHPPLHASSVSPPPNQLSVEEMVEKYRQLDVFGVLVGLFPSISNEEVAAIVRKYPDRFIGIGSCNPWDTEGAIYEIEKAVKEFGLRGMKFAPVIHEYYPNDSRFYPIWGKCQELGLPVLFHTGLEYMGMRTPGGGGMRQKYCRPIYLDDVAVDFPELTIVMAHPAWPWQEEQLGIVLHKGNVYMDLALISPKYYSDSLIHYMNTLIQDKVMFGTDFPYMMPDKWLSDFKEIPIRDEVRPKILLENAKKVYKI